MALNKNKVVALAQRYTVKGQLEKAIAEYRKIVQVDPSDIRTWLKIGDLYTRMGARKEATETYIRVAEQYTHNGFHLKAIAVYKQILNIDPTLVVIHQYLAASYLELGLTSEALIQLEQLADVYERTGRDDAFLEVLMHMGKIDSHNIATRLRIAELYSKQNRVAEAANQFSLACEELKNQGRREDFIKVAERLLYHAPNRVDVAQEMAAIYLERGKYKEALAKLQICFAKTPKDTGVLSLLASAFDGLGQPEKAISVYLEISEILKEEGEMGRRQRILKEILALEPDHEVALTELSAYSTDGDYIDGEIEIAEDSIDGIEIWDEEAEEPELGPEELAEKSAERLGEVQVLLKYGLKERALDHLGKIFEIDPYNIDARELAKDVLLELDRKQEALEHLFLLAEAFEETQPEGSIYYLHEVLKIDNSNQLARQMIQNLGGIMPEGLTDAPSEMAVEVEDEILLLDDDEDVVLINNEDLEQADALLDDSAQKSPDNWNALESDVDSPQNGVFILDGDSGELSGQTGILNKTKGTELSNEHLSTAIADIFDDSGENDEAEEEILDEETDDSVDPQPELSSAAPTYLDRAEQAPLFDLDEPESAEISEPLDLLSSEIVSEGQAHLSSMITDTENRTATADSNSVDTGMNETVESIRGLAASTERTPAAEDTVDDLDHLDELVDEAKSEHDEQVINEAKSEHDEATRPGASSTETTGFPPLGEESPSSQESTAVGFSPLDTLDVPIDDSVETAVHNPTPEPESPTAVSNAPVSQTVETQPNEPLVATSSPFKNEPLDLDEDEPISEEPAEAESFPSTVESTDSPLKTEAEPEAPPPDEDLPEIDDELEEIEFFMSQDLLDEAKGVLTELLQEYPNDPRLVALNAQLMPPSDEKTDETETAPQTAEPLKSAQELLDLSDELDFEKNTEGSVQFKNVGIKETLSEADFNTNWDLGLAYKEMGLFDDAIKAFRIASKDPEKTVIAKTMIGICFASLGQNNQAIQTFERGLSVENIDRQQKMGLLYELGKTYEMMQKTDKAMNCFQDIVSIDPTFADVSNRMKSLSKKENTNTT